MSQHNHGPHDDGQKHEHHDCHGHPSTPTPVTISPSVHHDRHPISKVRKRTTFKSIDQPNLLLTTVLRSLIFIGVKFRQRKLISIRVRELVRLGILGHWIGLNVATGIGVERLGTLGTAEPVLHVIERSMGRRRGGVDRHAAQGVDDGARMG